MIRVSIPRASKMSCRSEEPGTNAPKRVLSTMESFACTLELRPQLEAVAAAAGGFVHRLAAVGRRKIGEPSRPLGDCSFVNQVPDENVEAARCADRGADPVGLRIGAFAADGQLPGFGIDLRDVREVISHIK